MNIDSRTIAQIARLARLDPGDHADALGEELGRILELARALAEGGLDTLEPAPHAPLGVAQLREDAVTERPDSGAFLALAPDAAGDLYLVPRVLE